MQFAKLLLIGASFVATAFAQIEPIQFRSQSIPGPAIVGKTYTLEYFGGVPGGKATVTLKQGEPGDLATVETITGDATGGTVKWTPKKSGVNFALSIQQDNNTPNYTGRFTIKGKAGSSAPISKSTIQSAVATLLITNSTTSGVGGNSTLSTTTIPLGTAAGSSAGTGIPITRNSTFSSATLTGSSTATATATVTSDVGATTTGGGAGSTGSSTAAPTGAAAGLASPLAFVLCAFVGIVYLG